MEVIFNFSLEIGVYGLTCNAAVTIYFEDLASDLIDEIEKQQKGKKTKWTPA